MNEININVGEYIIDRKYTVYVHINNINGKMYVGITCQRPQERWSGKGCGYKKCPAFYSAIQKYGWDNFEHFIFASNLTKDEAENMEIILIKKLHTQDKQYGYNIADGGYTSIPNEETRKKMSESHRGSRNGMYGRRLSDEQKEICRQRVLGERNVRYGKKLSEEAKERIRQAKLGKPHPEGGRKPVSVRCVETGIIYASIHEAARQTGKDFDTIRKASINPNKTAYGQHWQRI